MASGAAGGNVSRGTASKSLTINEYKRRLKDSIRSINENFALLLQAAKIGTEDGALKNTSGRMAEYTTTRYELEMRAALIVRGCDELHRLRNDLNQFLILHDFNSLSTAIRKAEDECEKKLAMQTRRHNDLRIDISKIVIDIDKELQEHFSLRC